MNYIDHLVRGLSMQNTQKVDMVFTKTVSKNGPVFGSDRCNGDSVFLDHQLLVQSLGEQRVRHGHRQFRHTTQPRPRDPELHAVSQILRAEGRAERPRFGSDYGQRRKYGEKEKKQPKKLRNGRLEIVVVP